MNVNAGHERTSKARIIHQIQLIRGITNAPFARKTQHVALLGNDSNLLTVLYVQIMPDDFVMQLHRF
ncbi:hypothetical protein [Shigella dysenteriae]|uniref:hypothetical protein n=1 Tax=Shigella dysenteriae TaxID=622 RepID=UPI0028EE6812|nr:hypothetical protein [Shigella dysenteriae]WNT49320.1 hypothetical protein PWP84_11855 [Shigella dysenteriae]